jgi:NAD-dependent deacetylase
MTTTIQLQASERVFVLTGAGISAESGIATFRDAGGLWEGHRPEDVASPQAWDRDPHLVWRFYSERRAAAEKTQPNPGHIAIAELQAALGADNVFLCTQNVDALHEAGGSPQVFHMHGELYKTRCERPACDLEPFEDHALYMDALPVCPRCGARLRPHIVWFGEEPFGMHRIVREVQACDLFMTVGSSGVVYPAAGLVREVLYRRQLGESCRSVYVGLERPANGGGFQEVRLGKAGEVLPGLFVVSA